MPILVVDEAHENLDSLEHVLRQSGYRPLTLRNGADAIARLRALTGVSDVSSRSTVVSPCSTEPRPDGPEEHLRILFDHSPTPLILLCGGGRVTDLNEAAARMLGYADRSVAVAAPLIPQDTGGIPLPGVLPGSTTCSEITMQTQAGDMLDVEVSATRLAGAGEPPILLSFRDRTTEKRMVRHLQQVEKMSMMGRMASGIAHEIRNPLAAVMLNLQLLELAAGGEEGTRQRIAAALEGVNRIEEVVQSTLHLARSTPSQAGRERLHTLLDRSLWFLRVPLDQRGVRIVREYAPGDPEVTVDARQIQQVLLNLLQNALEASPERATITVRTTPAVAGTGERRMFVDIMDSGSGIPPVVLRSLFEPFVTTKPGGTGLGLNIARQIMLQHGGAVTVPSTGADGTTLRLDFPLTLSSSGAFHA